MIFLPRIIRIKKKGSNDDTLDNKRIPGKLNTIAEYKRAYRFLLAA